MAGNIDQAYRTATTLLSWLNKQIAKGNEKMIPASEVYSAIEINFLAQKCDDLAKMMRALPEDPMGDVKNSVNNLRQYKQVLTDAAGRLNTGETAHRISYRMSDRLGWVRFTLEALNRLEQGGGKSAKAAAVVAAAKAVGTPRVKAADPALRSKVASYLQQIRASMQRGYININTARGLVNAVDAAAQSNPDLRQASRIASDIRFTVASQPGEQMKEINETIAGYIRPRLQKLVTELQQL